MRQRIALAWECVETLAMALLLVLAWLLLFPSVRAFEVESEAELRRN